MSNELPEPCFTVGSYDVRQISKAGLWLVTTPELFDLGMLFWRAQEFYDSPNPEVIGKSFTLLDYMRWFCTLPEGENSFSYFNDYEGFNLPAGAIEASMAVGHTDVNRYDLLLARIATEVKARQGGDYYLIGSRPKDVPVLEHEIAHGMFYLLPTYRAQATLLVESLVDKELMFEPLRKEGYSDAVLVDETQAYLSTGLFSELLHLEHLRPPFMKLYARHKKKLIKAPKSAKEK